MDCTRGHSEELFLCAHLWHFFEDGVCGLNVWTLKEVGFHVYMRTSVSVPSHAAALVTLLKQGKGSTGWLYRLHA
jgi:hypothetical protein